MDRVERLYLVGFMGAGKSTVGERLAEQLGYAFRDLDELIVEKTGRTIHELFREEGEEFFRDRETELLEEQSRSEESLVLATGGGVPERSKNKRILSRTGTSIYLNVDFDVIYERIREGKNRPLVPDGEGAYEELRTLWENRQSCYEESDVVVSLRDEEPSTVVDRILEALEQARNRKS